MKMKTCAPVVCALALLVPHGRSDGAPPEAAALMLDGDWRLLVVPATEVDRFAGFFEPGFDDHEFRSVTVPGNWSLQGFEEPVYNAVRNGGDGFYRHRFRMVAFAERRVLLRFGGVWQSAEVWLNGKAVGSHDGGFTEFAFDVTPYLTEGENLLAVRVRQTTRNAMLDTNDDWSLPGIYRGVRLELSPRGLALDRLQVETTFDPRFQDADLVVRAFVARSEPADREVPSSPFEVRAVLTGPDGKQVQQQSFSGNVVGGFNGRDVFLVLRVVAPAPWTAETPALYDLTVDLLRDGRLLHSRSERVGFRQISTAGGVLRVNGRPVKLRGVCRHDEHPDVGRATRREHWEQDVRLMKGANINAVRTSHYPPAEGFLQACDELGLYVIDEVPTGYGGERLTDPSFAGAVLQRARETIVRDRNHPSVIIWSVGNEDPLTDLHVDLLRAVKGMDPTRPTLLPWRAEAELPPEVDVLAPHYLTAEALDRLAAASTRPVITTEYTHALGPEDFGGLEDRWRALTRHPAGAGGMIWLWADQGLRRPVSGRRVLEPGELGYAPDTPDLVRHSDAGPDVLYDARGVYGEDGIVNPDRSPQRDYWETKAVYAPVVVLDEEKPVSHGDSIVRVRLANEYDFTDLKDVRIEWRLMVGEREIGRGEARVQAPPHATGALEVPADASTVLDAEAASYIVLRFLRPDGSEIAQRSVRLRPEGRVRGGALPAARPKVTSDAAGVVVTAGKSRFGFDRVAGALSFLEVDGRRVLGPARPALWRPMTISERNVLRRRRPDAGWPPDLAEQRTTVQRWEVVESGDGVRVQVAAEHRIDARNVVSAVYRYLVTPDGALLLDFIFSPRIEAPWLPEAGMALELAPGLHNLSWQGLGPLDATPNKQAAVRFGLFEAEVGGSTARGTKAGVEWAALTDAEGRGFRVTGAPFIRSEATSSASFLRVLSAVQGSFTKFAGPERPEWRLEVGPGARFTGQVRILPLSGGL